MTIEVALLLSGVSVAFAIYFGIASKRRNEKKDTQEETAASTAVMMKLENIADDLKEIKAENRNFREDISMLRERVAKVESSLKSYHKRLDGEQHPEG